MKATKTITIDDDIHEQVKAQSKVEGRSYSNMIEWMAKKYLETVKEK